MHHLSTFSDPGKYIKRSYKNKKNIIVISPDNNKYKFDIIEKIKQELQYYKIIVIENFRYNEYKQLISRAKFSITFGEGLDGYYVEPTFSGTIAFSVYNEDFFTSKYRQLPTIYSDYKSMLTNLCKDINLYDNKNIYNKICNENFKFLKTIYKFDLYKEKLKNFYQNNYDFK